MKSADWDQVPFCGRDSSHRVGQVGGQEGGQDEEKREDKRKDKGEVVRMVETLDVEFREELEEAFGLFDREGDGQIETQELSNLLRWAHHQ